MEQNKTNIPPAGNNTPGGPNKKGPKFNLWWIYGTFAIALLAMNFWDKGFTSMQKKKRSKTSTRSFSVSILLTAWSYQAKP